MSDHRIIEQIITDNADSTPSDLADHIVEHLGLFRQYEIRDTSVRTGISISHRRSRPFQRWCSEWEDMTGEEP